MSKTDNAPIAAAGEITGHTRVLGILAYPIAHVKAPAAINAIARLRACDAIMVPLEVAPADLAAVADSLRRIESFAGAIITIPHKQRMASLCDGMSERAAAAGVVNVVRRESDGRLVGDALDGIGFLGGLRAAGIAIEGQRVFLSGAGGAAKAIAHALSGAGISALTVHNRTPAGGQELCRSVEQAFPNLKVTGGTDPTGHHLVINATSLGMHRGDPYPLDVGALRADMVVAEVVMDPEITPLLQIAQARGCRTLPASAMLHHQLDLMADFLGL